MKEYIEIIKLGFSDQGDELDFLAAMSICIPIAIVPVSIMWLILDAIGGCL